MTQKNKLKEQSNLLSAGKPIFVGAVIGLILISLFVFGVDNPKPEWGKFWMIKPLIVTPLAGAMGGLFFYFMNYLSMRGGINKTVAVIFSLVVFIVGLWLGIVLGLNGTMWN
ncbi:MAG: hypothetical protein ACTHJ5_15915 [Ilyomonas sp.]